MKKIFIFLLFLIPLFLFSEEPIVSIYDEFDEGLFGKSVHRGIIVSLKKAVFTRSETLIVKEDDDEGFLTAVVMGKETAENLMSGYYKLPKKKIGDRIIYQYNEQGLNFSFSIEKPNEKMISIVKEYYTNDDVWQEPLLQYYNDNYVIRIFSAENVFESWTEEITYNEAMVVASLIGGDDQWLWGIHDGSDILNKGY